MAAPRSSGDVAQLFGAAPAREASEGGAAEEEPVKRRIILKDSETVAAVLFRPWEAHLRMLRNLRIRTVVPEDALDLRLPRTYKRIRGCTRFTVSTYVKSFRFIAQASPVDSTPPTELWHYISAGTKFIAYHSELAARQEEHATRSAWAYRVGVGLSRHAGLLVNFVERLRTDKALIALLAEQPLKNATVEAEALFPYLQVLNFGKGSAFRAEQEHAGLRSLKKRGREEDSKQFPSEAQIDEAVTALFAWLTKPHSALRGLLLVLAASGLPFAAMAGERTLISWIQGGGATVEFAKEAANAVRTARTSGGESSASSAALAIAREAEVSALFAPKPKKT